MIVFSGKGWWGIPCENNDFVDHKLCFESKMKISICLVVFVLLGWGPKMHF